jgi:hypothetical protein
VLLDGLLDKLLDALLPEVPEAAVWPPRPVLPFSGGSTPRDVKSTLIEFLRSRSAFSILPFVSADS